MIRDASDLPQDLKYFITDTGDAVHGFAGVLENEREEARARRVYSPNYDPRIQKLFIGTYRLVSVEEVTL